MALMNLEQRHPELVETAEARTRSRDLYEGLDAVRAKGETYLFKGKNESAEDYAIRLKRATLDPYVQKIVVSRQAVVHGKGHVRDLPAALEPFLDDADMKGTAAQTFFEACTREAQVDGIHWVLIDAPRLPEGGYLTRAAEIAAGVRPFFQRLPAEAVVDWDVGEDRRLVWAVIRESVAKEPTQPGHARESVIQYKVWTRRDWKVYRLSEGAQASGYTLTAEGANPIGEVPLVPFFGVKKTDYSGWPVARSVLGHVVQIYNKESDLDWYETLAAHPIPWVISPSKPERIDVGSGLWVKSDAQGAATAMGYLETTGAAFSALRDSIRDVAARILSIALAQAKKESAQVQSAEGQREDRKLFTTSLKGFATEAQHSEQRCWRTLAKWMNVSQAQIDAINVDYNKDFDDRVIEAAMINALADLVDASQLTTETLLRILKDGEVLPEDVEIDNEVAALAEARAKSAASTLRLLQSNQPPPVADDPIEGGQAA